LAEAVEPHIAPVISAKFNRQWKADDEKRRFSMWWEPDASSIIVLDNVPVGWLASSEEPGIVTLVNLVVCEQYRDRDIASIILGAKLNEWSSTFKTVAHSFLKAGKQAPFFERFGFKTIREDDVAHFMEANIA
jgi:N-acetylglutamate synthase-like GNAT family acetyltransferase